MLLPPSADAAGQTYSVIQCHPLNRAHADALLEDAAPYTARSFCGDPQNDYAMKVISTGHAQHGTFGQVRWQTGSSDLDIVSVDLEAKLRRDNGHVARLWMADPHMNEVARVASGDNDPTAYRRYGWDTEGHGTRQFVASLSCERPDGCRQSNAAKTSVRDVRLEVADYADPRFAALDGTLSHGGWVRGPQTLHAEATDQGSGMRSLAATVNRMPLAGRAGSCRPVEGRSAASRIDVCDDNLLLDAASASGQAPFRDGGNALSVCASDFAGNRTCTERTVRVDNTPPAVAFATAQDPDDPELIRAIVSDATSGLDLGQLLYRPMGETSWRHLDTRLEGGELRTRVDSTANPPGQYEFMAEASDVAGNVASTTTRANGQPMVLTFPLKSAARLSAHLAPGGASRLTIGYGESSKVAGRLRDASGRPLEGQPVTVTEYFGAGALIDRRVRTVRTDRDGIWGERLPAGPSRAITASYPGTSRYLADRADAGKVRVKTKATLHLSRPRVPEGRAVVFRGRVAHMAARIPAGGKLVELQVKDGPHWHTVRQAFYTRSNGHFRFRYRFARFYTSNVKYRFRVRVLRELGWPYKAPVSSRVRRLVVKAR
ncbi:MAG: hypothetical protein ACRDMH_08675 [Solirubrobacterales bacterium]